MPFEGMRTPHLPTPDCRDILPLVTAKPAAGFRHNPLLPIALAFAAGAMIYVVVEEVIPEANASGNGNAATLACIGRAGAAGAAAGAALGSSLQQHSFFSAGAGAGAA